MTYFRKMTDDPLHENFLAFFFAIITPEYVTPDEAVNAVIKGVLPFSLNKSMVNCAFLLFADGAEESYESIKFYGDYEPHILEIARAFRKIDNNLKKKRNLMKGRYALFEKRQ